MSRSNPSIVVYLCLVFVSGALVGGVGYRLYNTESVTAVLKSNPCTADAVRHRYMDEMQTRLKLSPDQVQKLSAILEGTHKRFKTLREKYKPEVKTIQEEQVASIRAILNATQQAEYEKMRQEREHAGDPKKP